MLHVTTFVHASTKLPTIRGQCKEGSFRKHWQCSKIRDFPPASDPALGSGEDGELTTSATSGRFELNVVVAIAAVVLAVEEASAPPEGDRVRCGCCWGPEDVDDSLERRSWSTVGRLTTEGSESDWVVAAGPDEEGEGTSPMVMTVTLGS